MVMYANEFVIKGKTKINRKKKTCNIYLHPFTLLVNSLLLSSDFFCNFYHENSII